MAVVAAAELDPQGVEGDVELVVDHDQVVGRDAVELHQRRDRAAGLVHVAARAPEHDLRRRRDRAAPAGPRAPRRGRTCARAGCRPSGGRARRRRGSRRCAGARRTSGRGCPARRPARCRRSRSRSVDADEPAGSLGLGGLLGRGASAASASPSTSGASCSMPASASASASSASTSSAVGAWVMLHDQRLGVGEQGRARGQVEVGGEDLGADLGALDRDLDLLGDVGGLGLER